MKHYGPDCCDEAKPVDATRPLERAHEQAGRHVVGGQDVEPGVWSMSESKSTRWRSARRNVSSTTSSAQISHLRCVRWSARNRPSPRATSIAAGVQLDEPGNEQVTRKVYSALWCAALAQFGNVLATDRHPAVDHPVGEHDFGECHALVYQCQSPNRCASSSRVRPR